jgi:hypothetical protein
MAACNGPPSIFLKSMLASSEVMPAGFGSLLFLDSALLVLTTDLISNDASAAFGRSRFWGAVVGRFTATLFVVFAILMLF